MGLFSHSAAKKEREETPVPSLSPEAAQAILKAGDMVMTESRTRRIKSRTDEVEVTSRELVLTLPDNRPNGDSYSDFLKSIGATTQQVSDLDGMWLGDRSSCAVPRICRSYGHSEEGTMEVSMPLAPLEKAAGMTWEQANPAFAAMSKPMQPATRQQQ